MCMPSCINHICTNFHGTKMSKYEIICMKFSHASESIYRIKYQFRKSNQDYSQNILARAIRFCTIAYLSYFKIGDPLLFCIQYVHILFLTKSIFLWRKYKSLVQLIISNCETYLIIIIIYFNV